MKINVIVLMGMLLSLSLTSCSKPEPLGGTIDPVDNGIIKCATSTVRSGWTLTLPVNNSGMIKLILKHTDALRTMARTGNVTALQDELCNYETQRGVRILTDQGDINRIGFAPQLRVENYVIAMYHPNNYPDHFIVYNIDDGSWTRYEEGQTNESGMPEVYLTSN